ncbi:hypothetical protein COY52_09810 [Candidatus Desantisbacteria bacterium CG_4_10_14_0_8_um_filter_48_22]|uniref:AAA+ ATPase domain-containing protein n=1 Tax=Candidatus Desantisbacteria bacterium CG_4_10_14_0_8_um_filter_48_22 TaxID=1974543 RepID=A0A2M7S7H0_9BACT|nr:MAG: hypothetical protein AUJ67_04805 [Candidatus Desantisbacteria bacterium CG1_02_49_89]PIZ15429.1 MAG: hypothetical protein COY52_09810 [Candidatus Desantisbacteria bacterium CG_4_10_14_0_8_um_filter_48_22]
MELLDREIIDKIKPWLDKPEIIVLLGARQVGKTSIMKIIAEKVPGKSMYFDLEDTYNLNIFGSVDNFLSYLKSQGIDEKERTFVFIDEVQYLPRTSNFLKIIHDHYPNIKLLVSGSSSFDIKKKFSDSLTGRKIVFEIYPLSFAEFLKFKQSEYAKIKAGVNLHGVLENFEHFAALEIMTKKIAPLFEEYARFGGYPLPALTQREEERVLRLKEIHNTYIQKDIKDLARIENILEFNKFVSYLAVQISNLLNINEVTKEAGISRRTAERYISILEKTFVLNLVKPFYKNRQKEITKMAKLYFTDNGLRNVNIGDIRPLEVRQDKGALLENTFYMELIRNKEPLEEIYFWRAKDKNEVDFIISKSRELVPLEVKYQNFKLPSIPNSLKSFIAKYSPPKAVILTKDYIQKTAYLKTEVYFMPLWMA